MRPYEAVCDSVAGKAPRAREPGTHPSRFGPSKVILIEAGGTPQRRQTGLHAALELLYPLSKRVRLDASLGTLRDGLTFVARKPDRRAHVARATRRLSVILCN